MKGLVGCALAVALVSPSSAASFYLSCTNNLIGQPPSPIEINYLVDEERKRVDEYTASFSETDIYFFYISNGMRINARINRLTGTIIFYGDDGGLMSSGVCVKAPNRKF